MSNIAILVGVAEYDHQNNLPCCKNDADALELLIQHSGKNYDIKKLIDPTAQQVKDAIRIALEVVSEVEEFFFYFSGHGVSSEDDFIFCPRDFETSAANRTGLSRSFIFDALRDAKVPQAVFVVDACESGVVMIKRPPPELARRQPLERFILFSSSLDDQFSLTGQRLSLYTQKLVEACLSKPSGHLYYSDIEDFLKDAFSSSTTQTPFFVRQGTSLEKFAEDASAIHTLKDEIQKNYFGTGTAITKPASISLTEKLSILSARYATKESAQKYVSDVLDGIRLKVLENDSIARCFRLELSTFDAYRSSGLAPVVDTVLETKRQDKFVSASKDTLYVGPEKDRPTMFALQGLAQFANPHHFETTHSLKLNVTLSDIECDFDLEPNFVSLSKLRLRVLFVPTTASILTFYRAEALPMIDWEKYAGYGDRTKWKYSRSSYDQATIPIALITAFIEEYVTGQIEKAVAFDQG